jgi:hypothetical protein
MTKKELLACSEGTTFRNTETGYIYKLILVMAGHHNFQRLHPLCGQAVPIKTKDIEKGKADQVFEKWEIVK